jgi:hypothetical protein
MANGVWAQKETTWWRLQVDSGLKEPMALFWNEKAIRLQKRCFNVHVNSIFDMSYDNISAVLTTTV